MPKLRCAVRIAVLFSGTLALAACPLSLVPGCYFVAISGTGADRFAVAPDHASSNEGKPW